MTIRLSPQRVRAMTLIELIVVVIGISLLISLFMPSMGKKPRSKASTARKDISDLTGSVQAYQQDYNALPMLGRTAVLTNQDFTFGTFQTGAAVIITNGGRIEANNSDILAVLTGNPAPPGTPEYLDPLKRNPRRTGYYHPRLAEATNAPGLGPDGVFRDPWGNPYIMTLDMNGDGKCEDAFYRRASVSRGLPQQFTPQFTNSVSTNGLSDHFALPGPVMIWSFGMDGKASPTERADAGVNADNILSWR